MFKPLIASAMAVVGLMAATPAPAADLPVTGAALLEMARSGQAWCGEWRARDTSCEDIGFYEVVNPNQLRQTYRFKLSNDPNLEVYVQETINIEGGAFCSTFRYEELDVTVLLDGNRAPPEQGLIIGALLQESLAEYEGKKSCESFTRDSVSGELKATVTLDGERAPTLDSTYRLIAPDTRIHLRPADEGQEDTSMQA